MNVRGLVQRCLKSLLVNGSGNFFGAKRQQMWRNKLGVKKLKAAVPQVFCQAGKCNFCSIGLARKHTFPKKGRSTGNLQVGHHTRFRQNGFSRGDVTLCKAQRFLD
mgnify:CR=1 FL=1